MRKCYYCQKTERGEDDFLKCSCAGRALFKCGDAPTCAECQRAHSTMAKFFFQLLNSKQAIRSDSLRAKMFSILFQLACDSRSELRNASERALRDCDFAISILKNVNIFDDDQKGFANSLRKALPALPLSWRFKDEYARRLQAWDARRKCDAAHDALLATITTALNRAQLEKDLVKLIRDEEISDSIAQIGGKTSKTLESQIQALFA